MIWAGFAGGVTMGAITAVMLTAGGDEPPATAAGIDSRQLADMLPGLVEGLVDQQLAGDPAMGPELPLLDDPYDMPVDVPVDEPVYEPVHEPSAEPDVSGYEPVYVEVPVEVPVPVPVEVPVEVPVLLDPAGDLPPVEEPEFVPEPMVLREEDAVPLETFEAPVASEPVPTEPYSTYDQEMYVEEPYVEEPYVEESYVEEASWGTEGTSVATVSADMIEGGTVAY